MTWWRKERSGLIFTFVQIACVSLMSSFFTITVLNNHRFYILYSLFGDVSARTKDKSLTVRLLWESIILDWSLLFGGAFATLCCQLTGASLRLASTWFRFNFYKCVCEQTDHQLRMSGEGNVWKEAFSHVWPRGWGFDSECECSGAGVVCA